MPCFIQKMKQASVEEEQKLIDIRMGKVVPKVLQEVNIPDIPSSYLSFVEQSKK